MEIPALDRLADLLAKAYDVFRNENAVVSVFRPRVMFIGDIHGNLKALEFLLQMKADLGYDTLIFLGDYVDRGPESIAVLSRLLKLKITCPDNIILLRGNHETKEINMNHEFFQEIAFNDDLLELSNKVFEEMPVAVVVNNEVFCVHGGIPGPVDISKVSKRNAFAYLWNDPSRMPDMTSSRRGTHPECFGENIFSKFMQKNGFSLMIRGHSALRDGYKWWFEKKLLSIFSTPGYCGYLNEGAFATLQDGKTIVYVFGPGNHSSKYTLVPTSGRD